MLPLFRDERYFRVNNHPFVAIYDPLAHEDIALFVSTWRDLAKKEGLEDFYFLANDSDCRNKQRIIDMGFNAVYADNIYNIHHHLTWVHKAFLYVLRHVFGIPTVFKYKDAIKYMVANCN